MLRRSQSKREHSKNYRFFLDNGGEEGMKEVLLKRIKDKAKNVKSR